MEQEISSNQNLVIPMFVTMEDGVLKEGGEFVVNVHVVSKVPDVNKLPDRFGAKVGHGTHPWNYARNPISP